MKALRVFKVALTPFNLDNVLNISKGQPTHITIDNSNERQQTLTGLDTTHHTNATVYVPKNEEIIDDDHEQSRPSTRRNINDYNDYKIGKPSPPLILRSYTDNTNWDQLDYRISVDCAMATGASITSSEEPSYPPLGSWTVLIARLQMLKRMNQKLDFFQLFLSHQAIVLANTTWTFSQTSKVIWKLTTYFVTVIKTYVIKSPKLFGKARSMKVS